MKIDIRPAVAADIEDMSEVVDRAWHENYKDIFTAETIAAYTGKYRRDSFKSLLEREVDILVLTADSEIAALCAFQQTIVLPDCAEIMLMYVHPKQQNCGLGGRLLSYTLKELRYRGFVHVVLDTAERNENARRFYEKHGFTLWRQYEQEISYVTYIIGL